MSKISEIKAEILLIVFLILMILPFLILNLFNNPNSEDINWIVERKRYGFIKNQYFYYEFWSGRFFVHAVLSVSSFFFDSKSFIGYKIITLSMMLVFFYVLFLLISEITRNTLKFSERFLYSLTIFFLYLYAMPSISEGFYWLESVICYQLAFILILIFSIFYFRLNNADTFRARIFYTLISCLTIIAIGGSNEVGATLILMLITLLLIKNFLVENKIKWSLILFALVIGISVYISFSAPINHLRTQNLENQQFFYSIYNSLIFLIQNVLSWTFNSPLLVFTFLLIPVFFKIIENRGPNSAVFTINPIYSLLACFIFLYTSIFMIIWGIGEFPYDRILNFIYFVFLIGWFWNVTVLIFYIKKKFKISIEKYPKYLYAIAFLMIALFLIRENNVRTAYYDLLGGVAYKYDAKLNERYSFLLHSNSDSCEVDSLENTPKTIFVSDITSEPDYWLHKNYSQYFNKKSIRLKKSEPKP